MSYNISIIQLDLNKTNEILDFICNSIGELRMQNVPEENVKILIPDIFQELITRALDELYGRTGNPRVRTLLLSNIFGAQIYPHYKNEIVVYNAKFNFSNHPNQHKILLL